MTKDDQTSGAAPGITGALPAYLQIAEMVSRQIEAGILADGQRLPPEREMAAAYGVSVGTLRKSLAQLTEMGHLDRRQGSGNYIRQTDKSAAIYTMFRLERPQGGGLPSARLLSLVTRRPPQDIPAFGQAAVAYRFRRLRFLDDVPVALEEIWLDATVAPELPRGRISESLYKFYAEELGLWITRTEDLVSVAPVPRWTIKEFPLPAGMPAGYVERRGWSQHDTRVEYSRSWFDPAAARFVARQR
ncbi:MAG: GntR family transcriptional regulator [Pseudomonadota bacterium]|nr:GntR family transcriptional regulator [Pseudomonadota bacterium]MEC7238363.1 GntR family transcriptional regulator [Pseudomonadota bacterium]